jgi:hypothetical protein
MTTESKVSADPRIEREEDDLSSAVLDELRAIRLAVRRIVRDQGLGTDRRRLLIALSERIRRDHEGDAWILTVAARVIWSEVGEYLDDGITPTAPAPSWSADPVTRTLQAMVRSGLLRCPECRRPIPSLEALADWEDRDEATWVELVRREEATSR